MPPPFSLADPRIAEQRITADAPRLGVRGAVRRCRLVEARLRERRGIVDGWALFSIAHAGGDALIVIGAGPPITLHRFPDDPAMLTLGALLEAADAGEYRLARYQPGKSCTLFWRHGATTRVRKYLADGRAAAVAARHAALWAAVADDPGLRIAEPLALDPAGEWYETALVAGTPLSLQRHGVSGPALAGVVAGVVARLHAVALATDRAVTLEEQSLEARKKARKIRVDLPGAAVLLTPILAAIDDAEPRVGPARPTLLHGDLNAGQLLVDADAATIIDLDSLSHGDPERDLAELVVDVVLCSPSRPEAIAFAAGVVAAYSVHSGRPVDGERLLVHAAAELLTRAWRHHRRGGPGWGAALAHDLAAWRGVASVIDVTATAARSRDTRAQSRHTPRRPGDAP